MSAIPVSTPRVTSGSLINACTKERVGISRLLINAVIMKVPVKVTVWELLGGVVVSVVAVVVDVVVLLSVVIEVDVVLLLDIVVEVVLTVVEVVEMLDIVVEVDVVVRLVVEVDVVVCSMTWL